MMRWSIRQVLFLAFAALVLGVALTLTIAALLQGARAETKLASAILERAQAQTAAEIARLFEPIEHQLVTDLERIRIGQLPRYDTAAVRDQLLPPIRRMPNVDSAILGDANGYQLLLMKWTQAAAGSPLLANVPDLPPVSATEQQYFTRDFRPREWGQESRWTLWDARGTTATASWRVELPGYDPTKRLWHSQAMQRLRELEANPPPSDAVRRDVAWTNVYTLFTTKQPGISASAAARDPDGNVTIVAYDLLLHDLDRFTANLRPTPNASVFLGTAEGAALALPTDSNTDPRAALLQPLADFNTQLAAWAEAWRLRSDDRPTTFRTMVDGAHWHGSRGAFALGGHHPLWIGVMIPRDDVVAQIGQDVDTYAILALACLLVALLAAGWFAGRLATPLRAVVAASKRVAALQLDAGTTSSSRITELQELLTGLDRMRVALQQQFAANAAALATIAAGEELHRTTFELAGVGIVRTSLDGTLVLANAEFCRMLGQTATDLQQTRLEQVTEPSLRATESTRWTQLVARADQASAWETRFVHRDGRTIPVQVSAKVLSDAEGRPQEILVIAHDLSARLELEAQLRQSQRLEAVGRLAGGVAHDFNNLLTAILGHQAMALEQLPPEHPARADLVEIEQTATGASSLVRQLLTFARRDTPEVRVIDAGEHVRQSEKLLRRLLGEGTRLTTTVHNGPHPVAIDPTQFQQVIVNLAVNAQDAMPTGGDLTITVDRRRTQGEEEVLLRVADTGSGMSDEVRKLAFDPFFTTKEPGHGTGLGLATCYGIIEKAHGRIQLDSAPGRGTRVEIALPLAAATEAAANATTRAPETTTAASPTSSPSRGTVLVVEDEPAIRRVVQRILMSQGYRVLVASSGDEALTRAATLTPIDLLLTDVVMPGMNGGELARRLRELRPDLCVLLMSGYADAALADEIRGEFPLLPKPFTREALLVRVQEVLADWRARDRN